MTTPGSDLALYVHWPFCVSKCPYCDFNSHVVDHVDHSVWRDALLKELAFEADRTRGAQLHSIFFGGGTPSLMHSDTIAAVITAATDAWPANRDLEITLEANPGTVDAERFASFRDAGVNRLSLGVQSLVDVQLEFLGRRHSAAEAQKAITLAGQTFPRLSFDLIYARPGQTVAEWREELLRALDILQDAGGAHLSVYQLTIEDNTPFKTAYGRGDFVLPDEDGGSDLYDATQDILSAAGLPAYEISNHARPGDACRHNVHVWQGGAYAGIGPGAHGRVTVDGTVHAAARLKPPAQWLKRVAEMGHGSQRDEPVAAYDRAIEMVVIGLRLSEGLNLARLERLTAVKRFDVISKERLKSLQADGVVEHNGDVIRTTPRGRLVLNAVVAELIR
jgi:putative oxygen-independent coproporphyrinogen III oxidase